MKGFVVIHTLFIITLMALIVLTMQNNLQLDIIISNNLVNNHNELYKLETAALQIITEFDISQVPNDCILNNDEYLPNYLETINQNCSFKNSSIYYSIADLGEFACLRISTAHTSKASHHYWLTIVNKKLPFKMLKIRFIQLGGNQLCGQSNCRYVAIGVLSWNSHY